MAASCCCTGSVPSPVADAGGAAAAPLRGPPQGAHGSRTTPAGLRAAAGAPVALHAAPRPHEAQRLGGSRVRRLRPRRLAASFAVRTFVAFDNGPTPPRARRRSSPSLGSRRARGAALRPTRRATASARCGWASCARGAAAPSRVSCAPPCHCSLLMPRRMPRRAPRPPPRERAGRRPRPEGVSCQLELRLLADAQPFKPSRCVCEAGKEEVYGGVCTRRGPRCVKARRQLAHARLSLRREHTPIDGW